MSKRHVRSLLAGLVAAVSCASSFASYTVYNFTFTTDNGISSSGYFRLDESWVSSKSWQSVTPGYYSGTLNVGSNSGITSGAFTSLSVYNIPVADASSPYGIKFTVGGITYTALDNKDLGTAEYVYSLSYKPSGGTTTDSEILSHTFVAEVFPDPVAVPEIDGGKLPQVALLIGGLFLAYRSRKFLKLPAGGLAQPA